MIPDGSQICYIAKVDLELQGGQPSSAGGKNFTPELYP